MPEYLHLCESCNYEFELEYSIKDEPPKVCPKCGKETVKRLINCTTKGVVELYGQDLVDKIKTDTQQLKKEIYSSEKAYSNYIGETHYENLQKKIDKQKRDGIIKRK